MSQGLIIIGAASGIGRAVARQLAARGHSLVLAGRETDELQRCAADIGARYGTSAAALAFDAADFASHERFFADALVALPEGLFGVVWCAGYMAEHAAAMGDVAETRRMIDVNYAGAISVLNRAAEHLRGRGAGAIVAVTSVAGDRGRPSNYLYGSTKAALSTYLSGLRAGVGRHGVTVIDVKPGFVDTGMSYGLPGMFLVAQPERVAADIARAIRRRRGVVYTPWFWRWIMAVIRAIPGPVFRRMKL